MRSRSLLLVLFVSGAVWAQKNAVYDDTRYLLHIPLAGRDYENTFTWKQSIHSEEKGDHWIAKYSYSKYPKSENEVSIIVLGPNRRMLSQIRLELIIKDGYKADEFRAEAKSIARYIRDKAAPAKYWDLQSKGPLAIWNLKGPRRRWEYRFPETNGTDRTEPKE